MIKHKSYIEIEEHCTKLKIKGWESLRTQRNENPTMVISGAVDGIKFSIRVGKGITIGGIVDKICKVVKT